MGGAGGGDGSVTFSSISGDGSLLPTSTAVCSDACGEATEVVELLRGFIIELRRF